MKFQTELKPSAARAAALLLFAARAGGARRTVRPNVISLASANGAIRINASTAKRRPGARITRLSRSDTGFIKKSKSERTTNNLDTHGMTILRDISKEESRCLFCARRVVRVWQLPSADIDSVRGRSSSSRGGFSLRSMLARRSHVGAVDRDPG